MITHVVRGVSLLPPHAVDTSRAIIRLPRSLFQSLLIHVGDLLAVYNPGAQVASLCRAFPPLAPGDASAAGNLCWLPCDSSVTIPTGPVGGARSGRIITVSDDNAADVLLTHWEIEGTPLPAKSHTSTLEDLPSVLYSFAGLPTGIPISVHELLPGIRGQPAGTTCTVTVEAGNSWIARITPDTRRACSEGARFSQTLGAHYEENICGCHMKRLARPKCDEAAYIATISLLMTPRKRLLALGAKPPRGLLLSGPPGIGKTSAVHCACETLGIQFTTVEYGGREVSLAHHEVFRRPHPRVIFIDEIDALCQDAQNAVLLSSLMDRCPPETCIIAATNRPGALPPFLRRPGRFDVELKLHPPNMNQRAAIVEEMIATVQGTSLLGRGKEESGNVAVSTSQVVKLVAESTPGYVGGELAQVLSLVLGTFRVANGNSAENINAVRRAVSAILPVVLRDQSTGLLGDIGWDDVGGYEKAKKRLRTAVEWPLRMKETFQKLGLRQTHGILLHGPPGTGKTLLVRAAAHSSGASFLKISGAECFSCYFGEAEKRLARAFATARSASPAILFIDELDAIVGSRASEGARTDSSGVRERVLCTLLTEMDGIARNDGVIIMAATNRIGDIDKALLRPGRFDDIIEIGVPTGEDTLSVFNACSRKMKLEQAFDASWIAGKLYGKSCADIAGFCREAGFHAIREALARGGSHDEVVLCKRHFAMALQ